MSIYCSLLVLGAIALNANNAQFPAPIKVQWYLDPALKLCWQQLYNSSEILERYGIITVSENPDIILCNHVTQELLATNIPLIILERKDAASISYDNLCLLKNPQVKALFKNQILADPKLNQEPLGFNDSYHFGLLQKYLPIPLKNPPVLTPEEIAKIKCVVWNIHESASGHKNCPLNNFAIDFAQERPIDVFFAGTVKPLNINENGVPLNPEEPNLYQWHREQAVNAVNTLNHLNTVVLGQGQALSYEEYIEVVKKSKIVVSPWGFGEFCYRDFEAMQCGAVLVKPDTSFITYLPNIYQNDITYVPCTADFSDLEQVIATILENFDKYLLMRNHAKKLLQECCCLEEVMSTFAQQIHEAAQN